MKPIIPGIFILFSLFINYTTSAQCTLACFANVNVALDASGNATITPFDVLDSFGPDCGTLVVNPSSFDCSDIGSPVLYTVTDLSSGNECFGNITVKYIVGTMSCFADVNVALGPSGMETLTADILLLDPPFDCIPGLIINPPTVSCADIGTPVFVTVTDPVTSNSCWSNVNVSFSVGAMSCFADVNVQLGPSGSLTLAPDVLLFDPPADCVPGLIINPMTVSCADIGTPVFVTVTDPVTSNSCWSNVNVEDPRPTSCDIIVPSPVNCGDSGVIFSANAIGGYGPFDYEWKIKGNPNGWSILSGQGTAMIAMAIGVNNIKLEVTITDICGKKRKCSVKVECEEPSARTGIEAVDIASKGNKKLNAGFNIFPNPTTQFLNLNYSDHEITYGDQVYIVNQQGQRQAIFLQNQINYSELKIDVHHLRPGIYWLMIEDSKNETFVKKFIKY